MAIKKLSRRTALKDLPERLTVLEYSEVTDTGRSTIYDSIKRGDLPAIRIGRRVLIPREALLPE